MSNVEPTMSFIDHATKSMVNYNGDVTFNPPHHVVEPQPAPEIHFPEPEVLGPYLERIIAVIEKLNLSVHVEAPKVELPSNPAPIVHLPESTPHVINISLFNNKALGILVAVLILQLAMIGALLWR